MNKKPLPRNRIFVQTPFSHSTLKLERKKFTPQNRSLFPSISCFGVTKITTPTSKIMKMCEQILKKTAPQYNSNSLNCKKTKRRPIIAPAIAVRLLIKDFSNYSGRGTRDGGFKPPDEKGWTVPVTRIFRALFIKRLHENLMPSGFHLFITFWRTKNTIRQKVGSTKNCIKKDQQD